MNQFSEKINKLSRHYGIPDEEKMTERLTAILEMITYYHKQLPLVSPLRKNQFRNYINALLYAESLFVNYVELTKEVRKLAKESK
jgi:hypothetical protein